MKTPYDIHEISQLLSKFMAGETNLEEEQMLAQYFRTEDVAEEWLEYKEMFALFDSGQVDVDAVNDSSSQHVETDSGDTRMLPKAVREKPKIIVFRWIAAVAAGALLLLAFHFWQGTTEQPSLAGNETAAATDSTRSEQEVTTPNVEKGKTAVAQAATYKSVNRAAGERHSVVPKFDTASATDNLAMCIARLEAEMENLDDSVSAVQLERIIAADARLQKMMYRIVGKQAEQTVNQMQKENTDNYVKF